MHHDNTWHTALKDTASCNGLDTVCKDGLPSMLASSPPQSEARQTRGAPWWRLTTSSPGGGTSLTAALWQNDLGLINTSTFCRGKHADPKLLKEGIPSDDVVV